MVTGCEEPESGGAAAAADTSSNVGQQGGGGGGGGGGRNQNGNGGTDGHVGAGAGGAGTGGAGPAGGTGGAGAGAGAGTGGAGPAGGTGGAGAGDGAGTVGTGGPGPAGDAGAGAGGTGGAGKTGDDSGASTGGKTGGKKGGGGERERRATNGGGDQTIFGITMDDLDENITVAPSASIPFYDVLDPIFGVCYQFKPSYSDVKKREVKSVGAGQPHTVSINTYVDASQYLGHVEMVGTVITVHGEGDLAYTSGRTVVVPPGYTAYFGLKQIEINRVKREKWVLDSSETKDCSEDSSPKEVATFQSQFMYIASKCKCKDYFKYDYIINKTEVDAELNVIDAALENCGANDAAGAMESKDWTCVNEYTAKIDASDGVDDLKDGTYCITPWCKDQAEDQYIRPCKEVKIEISLKGMLPVGDINAQMRKEETKSDLTENGVKSDNIPVDAGGNLANAFFFYDDLKVISYKQKTTTSLALTVAGVGGYLGLFLGISILSLVEIMEYFVVRLFKLHES